MLVQAFVAEPAVEALDEGVLDRLSRRDVVPLDPGHLAEAEDGVADEFVAIVADDHEGLSPPSRSVSNSRTTRVPDSDVSATQTRHSREKSSTTFNTRKRRPSSSVSATKSSDQRWFAPCGIVAGARVPRARFRPQRLRTINRSSL